MLSQPTGSGETQETASCGHCHEGQTHQHVDETEDSSPVPACPCSNDAHDCICSGALIDGSTEIKLTLLPSLDLPAAPISAAASASHLNGGFFRDDGHCCVIDGRSLRVLIASFLC
jgi:hypothetical protein